MATTMPERTDSAHTDRRVASPAQSPARTGGGLGKKLVLVLLVTAGIGLAGVAAWSMQSSARVSDATLVYYTVKQADLPITVTENGSLQSQKTTEIRCQVENVGGYERGGTQILSIVPNGTNVKEGELLVELDAARIQDRLDEQELATERATSEQIQKDVRWKNQKTQNITTLAEAELKVELDQLALQQYEDEEGGTFQLELQNIDLQIQTAEAGRLIKATDLKGVEMLKKLGYRSKGDLEQARLSALSADREVARAVSQRKELVDYTYLKTMKQLKGAVESSKRALEQVKRDNEALLAEALAAKNAADRSLTKEEEKLAKYREQLDKCKILAPHDGMATYAIERDRRTHIREGAEVRQRQRIITLPDLSVMEVKTGVHESMLNSVKAGLNATVTVDAFPEKKFKASVKSVAVLADPGEWHSSDVKVYTTIVTIDEEVTQLRPGMSAVVDIHVDRVKDVLSVPVQAVVQIERDNWVYVGTDGGVEIRQVDLGKTNDKFVEIREGISEGDRVVLNPESIIENNSDKEAKEISPDGGEPEAAEGASNAEPAAKAPEGKSPAKGPTKKSPGDKSPKASPKKKPGAKPSSANK